MRGVQVSEGGSAFAPGGKTAIGSTDAPRRFGSVRTPRGLRIVWHYRQDGGERTFTLRYRLRGVVIAHDDAVEVAARVWGDQWDGGLGRLAASVHAAAALPGTHAWIEPAWLDQHVSVRGGDVTAGVEDIPSRRGVTLRVVYPRSALTATAPYARRVHDRVLPALVEREDAAEARAQRDRRDLRDTLDHPLLWILAAIGMAIAPAAAVGGAAYWLLGREQSTGETPEYVAQPPDDMPPALVPSLLAQREVAGGEQLAATLFELVRRGRYRMTAVTREQSSVAGLRHREVSDIELSRAHKHTKLSAIDEPVAEIFDVLTDDSPMRLSLVTKTVRDLPGDDRAWFHARSGEFETAVRDAARAQSFWSNHGMRVKWAAVSWLLVGAAGFLVAAVIGLSDEPLVRGDLILLAVGIGFLLSTLVVEFLPARVWRRRGPELQASAERWEAFRRYLRDFPRLAEKPADSLPLWEHYLIYGIAFGLADRVLEAARIQFPASTNRPSVRRPAAAGTATTPLPTSAPT